MSNNTAIAIKNLSVIYQNALALQIPSLTIDRGSFIAIIGPNGGGKTTFIKSLVQLTAYAGTITLFNEPLAHVRKKIAYVPQKHSIDWDFPIQVKDVVMMGRYPHLNFLRWPSTIDYQIVNEALEVMGIRHLADKPLKFLSGGQQQRVFLARAFAQQADLYLLDEPFNGVDDATEKAILTLLKGEQQKGKTIILIHHDLHIVHTHFEEIITINKTIISHIKCATMSFNPHIHTAIL
jgi:ABC-type Mn2+/Zn2+ transport system ATPase subunit